jgi:hypothetical protein
MSVSQEHQPQRNKRKLNNTPSCSTEVVLGSSRKCAKRSANSNKKARNIKSKSVQQKVEEESSLDTKTTRAFRSMQEASHHLEANRHNSYLLNLVINYAHYPLFVFTKGPKPKKADLIAVMQAANFSENEVKSCKTWDSKLFRLQEWLRLSRSVCPLPSVSIQ